MKRSSLLACVIAGLWLPSNMAIAAGGDKHRIAQQQPANARFIRQCGWVKVRVGVEDVPLYAGASGQDVLARIPRGLGSTRDVYLQRLATSGNRAQVLVTGPTNLSGKVGWIDSMAIEIAGEKCPAVYSPN